MDPRPASAAPGRARMHGLTRLRFALALWVVLFHYRPKGEHALPAPFAQVLDAGYLGVPYFFVLSGFVLAAAYPRASLADKAGRWRFGVRRFARLYPGFAASIVAFAALQFAASGLGLATDFDPWASLGALPLTLLGVHAWVPDAACAWNCPSWSLSVEFAFYAAFPALVLLSPRQRVAATAAAFAASTFVLAGRLGLPEEALLFNPAVNAVSFLFGMVLHDLRLGEDAAARKVAAGFAAAGAVALVALEATLAHRAVLHSVGALFAVGPAVVALSAPSAAPDRSLATRLGEASFALYIWHIPLRMALEGAAAVAGVPSGTVAFEAAAAGVAVLASLGLYRWLEVPAERWLTARLQRRPAPVVVPAGVPAAAEP